MPRQDNLLFQAISLLSQHLSNIKPEGEVYQHTSCLGAEEREIMAVLYWIKTVMPELKEQLEKEVMPLIENLGIAHWQRSELTDLGLRVGSRHRKDIKLAPDEVDFSIEQSSDTSTETSVTQ